MKQVNFLKLIAKWWLVILLFTIFFSVNAFLFFRNQPNKYQVTTRIYVNQGVTNALVNTLDSASADRATNTVAILAKSESVTSDIASKTGIAFSTIDKAISVKVLTGTQLIEVTTKSENKDQIAQIAKNIVPSLQTFLGNVQSDTDSKNQIKISVADNSLNPELTNQYFVYQITFVVMILSLFFFLLIFYLLEFFNDKFDTNTDLETLKISHLGDFGMVKQMSGSPAAIIHDENKNTAEMLREIRTNIEFLEKNKKIESLLVTSANPREGKSIFSANLAIIFAQAGKKVVLIDADMRNPYLHKMFDVKNNHGLSNYLSESEPDLKSIVKVTPIKNLLFINAGKRVANPSEILQSSKLQALKKGLVELKADLIIFDTPPLGIITDAAIIAQSVDGAILAIEKDRTSKADVEKVKNAFDRVNAKILGAVSTKVKKSKNYYGYY